VTDVWALLRWGRGPATIALAVIVSVCMLRGAEAQTRFMFLKGQSVHPAFEGWWPNEDGSFTMWFGYMNSNWEEQFDIQVGHDNYFALVEPGALDDIDVDAVILSEVDRGQPTHFYPRRNPFLFTIDVPADFGERELVWTLTTRGVRQRAYASLRPDYRMDTQVMSTEVGGAFGSLDDRLRTNLPPNLKIEGDAHRSVRVGEPLALVAFAEDPDDFPPRTDSRKPPKNLDELYSTRGVGSAVISGAPGLRMAWTVFRGPAKHVTFDPEQLKAWIDTRAWSNSPWAPPYVLPEVPPDNTWIANATFHEPGEYVLRAVASDGSHFGYENVTVQVHR
jgi:hypothetical protein